jgi:hypothetical protein
MCSTELQLRQAEWGAPREMCRCICCRQCEAPELCSILPANDAELRKVQRQPALVCRCRAHSRHNCALACKRRVWAACTARESVPVGARRPSGSKRTRRRTQGGMHHRVPHQGCCKALESHLIYSCELEAVAQAVIAACMSAANAAPHTTQTMSSSTLMTCSTCDTCF